MEFKKILVRSLSGIIYIAIIVGCILLRSEGIAALTVLFGILATIEFTKITRGLHNHGLPVLLADIAGVVCLGLSFYGFPVLLWIACLLWRLVLELYTKDSDSLRNLSYSIMGQVYIGIPLCTMSGVSVFFGMPYLLLAIFMFIWLNDTGAFIVGCTFGRHKLFERISPKKSWEGFFGGLLFCLGFSVLFGQVWPGFFGMGHNIWIWFGLAFVVSVFATWGDLVESMIKRTLKIKDSGSMIPGHGGILDRIDSLLLVMPAAFLYIFMVWWLCP